MWHMLYVCTREEAPCYVMLGAPGEFPSAHVGFIPRGPPSDFLKSSKRTPQAQKEKSGQRPDPFGATPVAHTPLHSVRVKQSIEDVGLGWEKKQRPVLLWDLQKRGADFHLVNVGKDNVRALEDATFGGERHSVAVVGVEEDCAVPPHWNNRSTPVPHFTPGGFKARVGK